MQPTLFDFEDVTPEPKPIPATFAATPTPALPAPAAPVAAPAVRRLAAKSKHRPVLMSGRPAAFAADFGEAVAYAWHNAHGGSRIDIPLGVVASLALWPIGREEPALLAEFFLSHDGAQLQKGYAEVMAWHWIRRPDLIDRARPLLEWTEKDGLAKNELQGIADVTRAALKRGVLETTGSADPYCRADVDLIGSTLTALRSHGARQGLGEYHTPPEVADVMARMCFGDGTDYPPGSWFNDPCAGTGGLFRSLVQHLREQDLNPHDYGWSMQDVDPLAAAGAAVNAIIWDLGPNAVVSCADTLAQSDVTAESLKYREALLEHRDRVVGTATVIAAAAEAELLLQKVMGDSKAA